MPVAKLTKRVVDTIKPGDRRVIYYDSELKGFGLKVSPGRRERAGAWSTVPEREGAAFQSDVWCSDQQAR